MCCIKKKLHTHKLLSHLAPPPPPPGHWILPIRFTSDKQFLPWVAELKEPGFPENPFFLFPLWLPVLCVTHLITPLPRRARSSVTVPHPFALHILLLLVIYCALGEAQLTQLNGWAGCQAAPLAWWLLRSWCRAECQVLVIFETFSLHLNLYLEIESVGRSRTRLAQKNAIL